ncbi:MAG: glycosyl hydrolase, partial [Anaerolineales bacterium]
MPAPSHAPFNNDGPAHISGEKTPGCFPLSASGRSAPLCVCAGDFPGVHRVAQFLRDDIGRVTGAEPELLMDALPSGREIVLIGTLGRNPLIDRMAYAGAFDAADLEGKRETFVRQEVRSPAPDVDRALVIAGSDKRGTLYGMLDLSRRIGVSPWHWWADVPVHRRPELYVRPER